MSEIRVKTRIIFEAEYVLLTEFSDTDDKDEIVKRERDYIASDPTFAIGVHGNNGKFTISVKEVEAVSAETNKTWIDGTYTIRSTGTTEV